MEIQEIELYRMAYLLKKSPNEIRQMTLSEYFAWTRYFLEYPPLDTVVDIHLARQNAQSESDVIKSMLTLPNNQKEEILKEIKHKELIKSLDKFGRD